MVTKQSKTHVSNMQNMYCRIPQPKAVRIWPLGLKSREFLWQERTHWNSIGAQIALEVPELFTVVVWNKSAL